MDISTWLVFPAALLLDLILADPLWLPHPVRWMGNTIEKVEASFRKLPMGLISNGFVFALILITGTWLVGVLMMKLAAAIHPMVKIVIETIVLFFCISARSLEQAAMSVFRALKEKDLSQARRQVAMIVGRETENLTEQEITRAAVETVAENFVDGFAAPLFWAAIGGAPLALAYKMVNTLDSMVGYKNQRYEKFGKAAARIDDIANYLPARMCLPIIAMGAQLLQKRGRIALKTAMTQGRLHTSPNAGYPEAAFAGTLAVHLGGTSTYHGKLVTKPIIGASLGGSEPGHIKKAWDLMLLSSLLWTAAITCFYVLLKTIAW